jgi:RHS repeat-associated protein
MKRTVQRSVFVVSLAVALVSLSFGQVATGTPPFGSFGGGPFDTVNLGNLNVHFVVPLLHKAGRGMAFDYGLSYDNSVWQQATVNGVLTWQPAFNWGWTAQTVIQTGYVSYFKQVFNCDAPQPPYPQYITYKQWVYHDPWGESHPFPSTLDSGLEYDPTNCDLGTISSLSASSVDGSGYSVDASLMGLGQNTNQTITAVSGQTFKVAANLSSGSGSLDSTRTDSNGNQISVSSSGVFTDTLGTTVLTVSGSGTSTSPLNFAYTAPSGQTAIVAHFTNQNVSTTSFGCSGVSNYTGTAIPLMTDITLPDSSRYLFQYDGTGRLHQVTLPTGGTITYTYSGGSNNSGVNCADGSTAALTRALNPGGSWSYTRTQVSGNHWQTKVTTPPDPTVGNDTVIDFAKDSAVSSTTNFYETQRVVYQGSAPTTPLATTVTCYNAPAGTTPTPSTCAAATVSTPILRTTAFNYLPTTSGREAETDRTYDGAGLGLIQEEDAYDYGSGAVGSLIRKTITAYAALGNGIVDHPLSVSVTDGAGNPKASTSYTYDEGTPTPTSGTPQHVAVSGSRGNVTTVATEATASTALYNRFTYYDTGTVATSTDVSFSSTTNGPITTYNYASGSASCGNSFVTSIAEPLGLSRSMTWDCNGGVLLSGTDENNATASLGYTGDPYWRPTLSTDPLGIQTTHYYQPNPTYQSPAEVASWMSFGNSAVEVLNYEDGFGRIYTSQRLQAPNSTTLDTVSYTYDSLGRLYSTSMPCSVGFTATCPTTPATTQTYDALGRPLMTTDGGGATVSYTYLQNDVLQSVGPTQNFQRQFEYDGLGRLTSVCEITSAAGSGTCGQTNAKTGYWTKYSYDALGDLTGVTQNAQGTPQPRSYGYDFLARLTSETNPESGTTSYAYDSDLVCGNYAGDQVKRVDAQGNVTCYSYDQLQRVTGVTYPSGPYASVTPPKTFVYDATSFSCSSGANVKGRLAEAYTGSSGSKATDLAYCYSPRGELTDVYGASQSFTGYYHVTKSYWANGALKQLSGVPGLPTVYYGASDGSGLDGEGRYTKVLAASGPNPITNVSYNTDGQVTGVTFGSGDSDSYLFDPNTGRMTKYTFSVNGQSMVGTLGWNQNGTLGSLNTSDPWNSGDNGNCTYTYDDLSRIASVSNCSGWAQTFTYDPFGNITKSGSISWQPGYDPATNHYQLAGTHYDNNGNVTADTFHAYQWDAEGNIITVDAGGTNYTDYLTYDAFGSLAEYKQTYANGNPTWLAQYVYGAQGRSHQYLGKNTASGGTIFHLPLPAGARMASYGTPFYGHADWRGDILLNSTASRAITSDAVFAPFGEVYNSPTTYLYEFAELKGNLTDNLWDADARHYHAKQGRWVSPDPGGLGVVDPSNPQTWNRYAYVGNNPLSAIDPSGLDTSTDCGGPCTPIVSNIGGGCFQTITYTNVTDDTGTWASPTSSTFCMGEGWGYADTMWSQWGSYSSGGGVGGGRTRPSKKPGQAANNGPQKACPAVPAHPANANVNSNISLTNVVYYANWLNPPTQAAFTDAWLVSQVRPNGPWDYKTQGQQYDAFGNFNFGATGGAAGIPLQVLQAGAGAVSTLVGTNSSRYGSWYQPPLYGHAPIKSDMIAAGYAYYQQGCK